MSAFLTGLIGGAVQGATNALELQESVVGLRTKRRAEQAAEDLKIMFEEAAKAGGLSKMSDDWFTKLAANVAATGDIKNAMSFAEAGETRRASRLRDSAFQAGSLLSAGAFEAAAPYINQVFQSVVPTVQVSGFNNGTLVLSDGTSLAPERLQSFLDRMSNTPEEALKLALKERETASIEARNRASAEKSWVDAMATMEKLPYQIAQSQAAAEASRASAMASLSGAQASADRNRREEELHPLEKESKTVNLAQKYLELDDVDSTEVVRGMDLFRRMSDAFTEKNDPLGVMGMDLDPRLSVDPFSPQMAPAGQMRVMELIRSGLEPSQAIAEWQNEAWALRDVLIDANPELETDPALLAGVMSALALDPNQTPANDAEGQYVEVALPTGRVKVYIQRNSAGSQEAP